jgi:diguanylate cyclase (GGDEF)-like protein
MPPRASVVVPKREAANSRETTSSSDSGLVVNSFANTTSMAEGEVTPSDLAERYRVLLDIGRSLTGTLSYDDLYQVLYREASRVLEVAGFYIALYHHSTDLATIVFYADRGNAQHVEISFRGSESEVLRTGASSLVDDRLDSRSVILLGDTEGEITRSAISAPLMHEGRVLGVISAQSYRPRAYTQLDLELLEGIAGLAAGALENARYVNELQRRRQEAERVEEIGRALLAALDPQEVLGKVIDACLALVDADDVALWLVDPDRARARVAASAGRAAVPVGTQWKLDGALADRLIGEREAFVIDDLSRSQLLPEVLRGVLDAGSGMFIPLIVDGEVGGFLTVGNERVRRFSSEDTGVLQRLASQGSLALENARLHASLQALSLTDPLTGLANRRHLQIHLEREVAAARRGRSIAAVMFDLDDFKRKNDVHGHTVGDSILRAFARVLSEENRAMNLVARYGGDEFAAVLTDGRKGARPYVQRVRRRVATDPVLTRYAQQVSIGLANFDPAFMETGEDLLSAADADLYRQKQSRPLNGSTTLRR